ncbi:uncharacterized protein LOC135832367 [Planococcus citri]|uniref:uncharacterized protein LOC135832367 n=1 Tax=Planococcus citri TaxID=170843 RepID=UPI0031F98D1D
MSEIPAVTVKQLPPKQIIPLYKLYISEVTEKPNFLKGIEKYSVQICGEITYIHRISNKFFAITVKDNTGKILAKRFEKEDKYALLDELGCTKVEPNKTMQSYLLDDFVFEASRLNIKENDPADRESAKLANEVIDWLVTEVVPGMEQLQEGRKIILTGVFQKHDVEEFISIFDYRLLNNDIEFHDVTNEFKYLHKMVYK